MDVLFYLILLGAGLAGAGRQPDFDSGPIAIMPTPGPDVAVAPEPTPAPPEPSPGPSPEATPASPGPSPAPASDSWAGLTAETAPPDRMTSAIEVRPILSVTKPQWISVRDYDGQDLLYFTNLLAWRCGLLGVRYSVNGAPVQDLPMEPCYLAEATPNAIKAAGILPYVALPPGSVQTVTVEILYDDLGTDAAEYSRADIQVN